MTSLTLDLQVLAPALIPVTGAVLVLLVDLVAPRLRRVPWAVAGLASLAAAAATVPGLAQGGGSLRETLCLTGPAAASASAASGAAPVEGLPQTCFWQADALGSTLQLAAAGSAFVCVLLAWPRALGRRPADSTSEPVEVVLLLTALTGSIVVAASRDVGTWLIALELATLPVVALVALSGRRTAIAGATQLLVTSLVSFALLVLAVALWFAATGSPFLTPDAVLSSSGFGGVAYASVSAALVSLATVLVLAGVGFKLSLVPFHAWTPTAYAGASTPVAAFLATVSKIAALAALLVVLRAVTALGTPALIAIALLAVLSMTLGNVMALRQDDVVRLLAWSTVAQAGWVVMPLVSISALGIGASATYLLTYVVATLVAFAVVAVTLHDRPADGRHLAAYDGLWRRSPWRAGALLLALTSLAGLPPGIFGLVGKVAALRPVVAEGWVWLAAIAAANAVLGIAVYLRWLRPVITVPDGAAAGTAPVVGSAALGGGGVGSAGVGSAGVGSAGVGSAGAAGRHEDRRRGDRRRGVVVAGLVLSAAVLVAVSVQPDLVLQFLG